MNSIANSLSTVYTVYECMHQCRSDTPVVNTGHSTLYYQEPGSADEMEAERADRHTDIWV